MRVHIQIDDDSADRPLPDQARLFQDGVEIVDAGGPPAELVRSLDVDLREAARSITDDVVDAGAAPDA